MTSPSPTTGELVARLRAHGAESWAALMDEAADRLEACPAESSNANLFRIIADIREASGLGAKPMLDDLPAAIGQLAGDLAYAKGALDRETARAIKFGKKITALEARVAQMAEALKQVVADYDACSGAEPSLSVLHRSIDLVARAALSQSPDREGKL